MSIIYVLIPIAMLFVLVAVGVFFWAVKSDQFDDLDKQSISILFEDDSHEQKAKTEIDTATSTVEPNATGKNKDGE
ncbi:cbb3-type cytochrome oxidase assembly protein CcoS [Shewanella sp. Choline-02u-19]|jgi:cbb3-type cytochrome oxidase maturation protein|uniref:cbb3-type cytochrome oxidase assembly protein CcoS n=1 Tax=unclassified Shewanella TaxID=196818 RepID=UPI000C341983|nr:MULTISPECIES: cbb3-type cytochrome oxidase assembly protein CcoS [unclassified Shewanella]PKG58129.1 cbb3-type cytochrome oxidase assembly protein CcoS [Shewanella sp. GutDb-MelDb]PKG73706.1 cbb3-type cytochrome oxidase assembly protein CcoS [Shewanella sp. GutCb]PKH56370.1 cbb3-type cytochrome oxidase assembly protein CcoS [Shewanella sp. Bg11-22]PKI27536.1 cbb3-type cytochrome oxidase assembly protein CcoS [Shewanella sp. Choline-02u-19]